GSKVVRHKSSDFEPSDFKKKEFTAEKWWREDGAAKFAATSSVYFSNAVAPVAGPQPFAEDQIEERWDNANYRDRSSDPGSGWVSRSLPPYREGELAPGAKAEYKFVSFTGPKERDVLTSTARDFSGVLNLGGFLSWAAPVVTPIAKVLVSYLYVLHRL